MHTRCSNPKDKVYADYGAKGVTVDPRWDKFENFLADMGERPDGTTLDRIKNELGYAPGNCRWATKAVQRRNCSRTVTVEWKGVTRVLSDVADMEGLSYFSLHWYFKRLGMSIDKAVSIASKKGQSRRGQHLAHAKLHGYTVIER
jgi:hypothetical protein